MTPTPDAVPDLLPGAPQREAGLDLHPIAGRPSTTPWLRSYPDVPPRARSAPRGAMTLAPAPTLARHAEHAPIPALFVPRPLIASLVLFALRSRPPTPSRSRRTGTHAWIRTTVIGRSHAGIAEVALANTRRRAARRRHSLTRRCIVLNSSSGKVPGASAWRRWSNPFAVASGSDSSHVTTRGHTASSGSLRVRQWRGGFGPARCVGRTSPSFHAVARLCRKRSRSASR